MVIDPCALCASTDRLPVHDRARGDQAKPTGICTSCGLVQFDHRPSAKELAKLYASGAFSEDARGARAPDHKKLAASDRAALRRHHRLLDVLPAPSGPVLEVGGGLGSFLFLMRGLGLETHGIEPDPTYAKLAGEWHGIRTDAALLEDIQLRPKSYGLVALFHVLEHMRDPVAALTQLREATADDGHLYVEVPSVERPYGGDLDRFFWAPHLQSFSAATLTGALRLAGFEPLCSGHDGDFLWMVAQASKPANPKPNLPFDAPQRRQQALQSAHHAFQRRREREASLPAVAAAAKIVREARKTWRDDPDRLRRALISKAGRAREELGHAAGRVGRKPWVHYAVTGHAMNSGDTVLFDAVRSALGQLRPKPAWDVQPLRRRITHKEIAGINRRAGAVVVGGGGLFLRDTVPDSASGWQWNIAQSEMEALEVPLLIYAVGYNRFRGQDDFDELFESHVRSTVAHSAFFGLRNQGSIRSIKEYLPANLHDKVVHQPCPTTVLNQVTRVRTAKNSKPRLSLNVAFDRQTHRFGNATGERLEALAEAARHAHASGWEIDVACHTPEDEKFAPFLTGAGIPHTVQRLYGRSGVATVNHYARCDLSIGMRGHAQMIPFGIGVPILSLVSHEKMQWFLDDIDRPQWGVELLASEMADAAMARIDEVGGDRAAARAATAAAQAPLWQTTQANLAAIQSIRN